MVSHLYRHPPAKVNKLSGFSEADKLRALDASQPPAFCIASPPSGGVVDAEFIARVKTWALPPLPGKSDAPGSSTSDVLDGACGLGPTVSPSNRQPSQRRHVYRFASKDKMTQSRRAAKRWRGSGGVFAHANLELDIRHRQRLVERGSTLAKAGAVYGVTRQCVGLQQGGDRSLLLVGVCRQVNAQPRGWMRHQIMQRCRRLDRDAHDAAIGQLTMSNATLSDGGEEIEGEGRGGEGSYGMLNMRTGGAVFQQGAGADGPLGQAPGAGPPRQRNSNVPRARTGYPQPDRWPTLSKRISRSALRRNEENNQRQDTALEGRSR